MSDLQRYIAKRKANDPEFAAEYDSEYESFKIGAILKQARLSRGMTQEELAQKLHTQKTAISRIENHAEDIRLSTIEKYLHALDKNFRIIIEE
jgi:HTH-type transcriptional regulator / antitoxin HipB